MKIEAWPFLVGRNRNLGYQPIVSPQFLSERGLSMLLAEAAGGDDSVPDVAIYREVRGSEVGDISLIFRVVRAKAQDYDIEGDEALRDRGSRPIRLIEGFVVRGRANMIKVTRGDLQTAHNLVKEAYRKFWDANDMFKEVTSSPFGLPTENLSSEQVQLIIEEPFKSPRLPLNRGQLVKRLPGLVTLIVLALLIVIGLVTYNFINRSTPDRTLSTFCSDLLTGQAANYRDAYHQLADGIQPSLKESTFVTFFTQHKVTSCVSHLNSSAGNSATLMITYQGGVPFSLPITLQEQQNYWKITTNIINKLQH